MADLSSPQIPAKLSAPHQQMIKIKNPQNSFGSFLNGTVKSLGNAALSSLTGGLSNVVSGLFSNLFSKDPLSSAKKQLDLQSRYNKDLYDYQLKSQLNYQKEFNQMNLDFMRSQPSAQVAGYKDAGLNPAALSGGSFSSPVSASQSGISGVSAPDLVTGFLGTNSLLQGASQFASRFGLDSAVSQADIALKKAQMDKSVADAEKVSLDAIEKQINNEFLRQRNESEIRLMHGTIDNNEKLGNLYDWQVKEMAVTMAKIEAETENLGQQLINLKQMNKYDIARTVGQNIDNMLKEPMAKAQIEEMYSRLGLNNAQTQKAIQMLPFEISNMVSHGESLDIGNFHMKLENNMLQYDIRERYWESGAKANPFYQGVSAAVSLLPKLIVPVN